MSLHGCTEPAMMTPLAFAVCRREPMLVSPSAPTPHETKRLSVIDNKETLRLHVPLLLVYRGRSSAHATGSRDPADAIRRALSEALVPYYPLAGRLREVEEGKLVVDCTGEGVMFVEADADVRLVELEADEGLLVPPLPWIGQLLCDDDCSSGVLNFPLLLVQVTRLLCGGFILALRINHNITDGIGFGYFLSAVAELARGLPAPTAAAPPWSRELLEARVAPRPAFPHCVDEYDAAPVPSAWLPPTPPSDMVVRTFTFTQRDVASIKKCLPTCLRGTTTTFEALSAALWRAHTAALELSRHEEVRLALVVSFRGVHELGIPTGYYGNTIVPSTVLTTAGELQASSLGDTVEMVREAKAAITAEYVRSAIDLLVLCGQPSIAPANLFAVSDNRHLGFHRLDLGWGVPVYGGIATVCFGGMVLVAVRNSGGEDVVAVPVMLPRPAMDRFALELGKIVSSLLVDEHSIDNRSGLLVSLESCKALFPTISLKEKTYHCTESGNSNSNNNS